MAQIEYTTPDGTRTVERDDWHVNKNPVLIAFDRTNTTGNDREKVTIPISRVVEVRG